MRSMKKAGAFLMSLAILFGQSAWAYQDSTLRAGMQSEEVRQLQLALIDLGYLGGTADGIYGTHTELAVRKFQKKNGLKADGLAGTKTQEAIYAQAGVTQATASGTEATTAIPAAAENESSADTSNETATTPTSTATTASTSLFGGDYSTMKAGSKGSRVKILQKRLKELGYLTGSVDGSYGKQTRTAVREFQRMNSLHVDGIAGKKTLQALESSTAISANGLLQSGNGEGTGTEATAKAETPKTSSTTTVSVPVGSVKLLHWFNDVKPTLKNGQTLLLVDPTTGISWKLRIYSCGRHCDSEPLTAEDTANMIQAFGGKNTWNQQAVYVQLPSGTWTIGSTHDMPHDSGSIKDNNFSGHLCVHFLRDMEECEKNDPKYGVANQKTIRAFWKELTGETIE